MKPAYYNEIDTYAADWLRNLIAAGHIAAGDVDTRSIEDVHPDDIRGYNQCHFFAGIGVWSYALRRAGWADDRPVWTGSCPCQPFSAAGKGAGFADERHLWPSFHHLIQECRPAVVFGEQVASSDVGPWLDLVQDDVEALGYAFGAVPFPAAGVGAPHIRDRLYWVADADEGRRGRRPLDGQRKRNWAPAGWIQNSGYPAWSSTVCGLANTPCGRNIPSLARPDQWGFSPSDGGHQGRSASGPTNGFWRDADWLACRDGRWRPVEPGTFPLAHGAPARVGRLRAYGNAIVAQAAVEFVRAFL